MDVGIMDKGDTFGLLYLEPWTSLSAEQGPANMPILLARPLWEQIWPLKPR